jgi:hypothetical protein
MATQKQIQASLNNLPKEPVRYWLGKKLYPHMVEALRMANSKRKREKAYQWKIVNRILVCSFCKRKFEVKKPYMLKTQKYCSYQCRSKANARYGEKHPMWKGGITTENEKLRKSLEYKAWRKTIFERDNYTCQLCGTRGKELNADHIKQWSKFPNLRFKVANGRTLCKDCHRLVTAIFLKENWINQFGLKGVSIK